MVSRKSNKCKVILMPSTSQHFSTTLNFLELANSKHHEKKEVLMIQKGEHMFEVTLSFSFGIMTQHTTKQPLKDHRELKMQRISNYSRGRTPSVRFFCAAVALWLDSWQLQVLKLSNCLQVTQSHWVGRMTFHCVRLCFGCWCFHVLELICIKHGADFIRPDKCDTWPLWWHSEKHWDYRFPNARVHLHQRTSSHCTSHLERWQRHPQNKPYWH